MDDNLHRCQICDKVPKRVTSYNPFICTSCGKRVCQDCRQAHFETHRDKDMEAWLKDHGKPHGKSEHIATTGRVDDDDIPF